MSPAECPSLSAYIRACRALSCLILHRPRLLPLAFVGERFPDHARASDRSGSEHQNNNSKDDARGIAEQMKRQRSTRAATLPLRTEEVFLMPAVPLRSPAAVLGAARC